MKSLNHTIFSTIFQEYLRLARKMRKAGSVLTGRTICIPRAPFFACLASLVYQRFTARKWFVGRMLEAWK